MGIKFEPIVPGEALPMWCQASDTMRRVGANAELLELAKELGAAMRKDCIGDPPAVVLAELAAKLNTLVAIEGDIPAAFLVALIGLTSVELSCWAS